MTDKLMKSSFSNKTSRFFSRSSQVNPGINIKDLNVINQISEKKIKIKKQQKEQAKKYTQPKIVCLESRFENSRKLYSRFQIGPFKVGRAVSFANGLRRSLLADISSFAIVAVDIEGASHEFCNLKGVRDSVLDILLNLKQVVLVGTDNRKTLEFGYLKIYGPGIVKAGDLKLPSSIYCVDPDQYIAEISSDGLLNIKFFIAKGTNFISFSNLTSTLQKTFYLNQLKIKTPLSNNTRHNLYPKVSLKNSSDSKLVNLNINLLPIDPIFMPVTQVNYTIQDCNAYQYGQSKEMVIMEVWTNGSLHPKQAIMNAASAVIKLFIPFVQPKLTLSKFLSKTNFSFLNQPLTKKSPKQYQKFKRFFFPKLISLDICNLNLSLRSYTSLKQSHINTIDDLLNYTPEQLLLLKNFGKRSLDEVKKALLHIKAIKYIYFKTLREEEELTKVPKSKKQV